MSSPARRGLLLSTLTLLMALESRRFIPLFAISGSIVLR